MTNAVLMERLCELVLQPRQHLLTHHGVLGPASGLRPKVVPRQAAEGREEGAGAATGCRRIAGDGGVSEALRADNAVAAAAAFVGRKWDAVTASVCGGHTVAVAAVAGHGCWGLNGCYAGLASKC